MTILPLTHRQVLTLGTYGAPFVRRSFAVPVAHARAHMHVIGVSGSGKSRFLAGLYLDLLRSGQAATLIDPHGDLARLVLAHLVADGFYDRPGAFERVAYLDIPGAERAGRYLPLNVLAQQGAPHTVASNVKEAMHRAWPALAGGAAPMFDTLVQDGAKVLISNELPLTALYKLLTDKPFRDAALQVEDDPDIVAFFHDQFDRLSLRDQADQAGAALRRAHLLTFSPVLKYSLSQPRLALDFRQALDRGQSLIVNLALADGEARRLLGCLLTVAAEHAALSRAELPPDQRGASHHLVIDEFSEFTAQSEEALARMLSQTRKYGLYLVMAHQNWSQTSARLRGALQNVSLEAVFRLGREDAEYTARMLGAVDATRVKHEVADDAALDRTHPVFYSLPEQWEELVEELQELRTRHAYLALHNVPPYPWPWRLLRKRAPRRVQQVTTPAVPDPVVPSERVAAIEAQELERWFRSRAEIERALGSARPRPSPGLRRWESVEG